MAKYRKSFLTGLLKFSNKYDDLKIVKENKDIERKSEIAGMEKYAQTMVQKEELIRLCNRREKYDDEGKPIPQIPAYEMSSVYQELSKDGGVSWMCDKCMAMNFGNERICAECGDIKDEKDERISGI